VPLFSAFQSSQYRYTTWNWQTIDGPFMPTSTIDQHSV